MNRKQIYAESSLMFMHVMYDVVMDLLVEEMGCRVDVIILRRYMPWVAESYTRPSTGPAFQKEDFRDLQTPWMWTDESKATLTRIPKAETSQLPWQIRECLYNLIEIEAKAQWFMKQYSDSANLHIHEFRTEEITTTNGVRRLLDVLDLDLGWSDSTIQQLACQKVNAKPGSSQFSVEDIENIYLPQYLKEVREQNIQIPPLPQLRKAEFPSGCR